MFDIDNVSKVQSMAQLCDAYKETYSNEEKVSSVYVAEVRMRLKDVARKMGCLSELNELAQALDEEFADTERAWVKEVQNFAERNGRGMIASTSGNYGLMMMLAPRFANLRLNELTGLAEVTENGRTRLWRDADDSLARTEFETEFGIHNLLKYNDGMNSFLSRKSYHPIKDKIEAIKWDGVDRISMLLHNCLEVEDTPYTREVSRLIFAGGINRLYRPGCKFDDMPVLIGKQGAGKSTFVRWLAMDDDYFTELRTIDGKDGMEAIRGAWIVEVSELLALTRVKEQEAVKAYLSTLKDKYRPAYARNVVEQPRSCIFIGTSNRQEFIVDKTGGRRFYPVTCRRSGYDLFDHEAEIREYIRQCWGEAYAKLRTPFMAAYADARLRSEIEEAQEGATEDDYRVGVIEAYLEKCDRTDVDKVCFGMLWEEALGNEYKKPERADQTQIGLIMGRVEGWERTKWKKSFGKYGKQRGWERQRLKERYEATYNTPNDDIPF